MATKNEEAIKASAVPKDIAILFIGVLLGIFGNLFVSSLFEILNAEYQQRIPPVLLIFLFVMSLLIIMWAISCVFNKQYSKIFLIIIISTLVLSIIISLGMIFSGLSILMNQNAQNLTNNSQIPTINVNILDNNQIPTIIALLISFLSIIISAWSLHVQRKHEALSVRPYGQFKLLDGPDKIGILFYNHGTGPLVIKSIEMFNENNQREKNSNGNFKNYPIDWIEPNYRDNVEHEDITENIAISNGQDPIKLLYFEFDSNNASQNEKRAHIRAILKKLSMEIRYTDISKTHDGISGSSFEYFGRTGLE